MSSASTYLRQMSLGDMDAVCEVEKTAYSHPWSRGNFEDSLRSGYWAQVLVGEDQSLWGYVVAMPGVQETHLLNLTVVPDRQGQGWARHMLDALVAWSHQQSASHLWLEVRASNAPAIRLYQRSGFQASGLRKNYYPSGTGEREHAILMEAIL
mgnify:CR=1 FL=1